MEIKDEENDRLRLQLQEVHKKLVQQAEDHEVCVYSYLLEETCDWLFKHQPFLQNFILV